jgi:chromosome partitioning protein
MLDWLKRKSAPAPGEQLLESEDQKPLTDERLGRLLGRLGPDSRPRGDSVAETSNKTDPLPTTDDIAVESPAAEAVNGGAHSPSTDSRADDRGGLRREDLTITRRGQGPSAAELLAKGYSFATGPDGKLVVFDSDGRLTDTAPPRPSAVGGVTREPAAAPVSETDPPSDTEGNPLPEANRSAAEEPVATAVQETASLPPDSSEPVAAVQEKESLPPDSSEPAAEAMPETELAPPTDRKRAKKPAKEALQETDPPPRTDRKRAKKPAPEAVNQADPLPMMDRKAPKERGGGFTGMYVIAVASQKGGSGKTTIAAHLAVRAAAAGNGPVVLIDTDPQGSLAEWWHARADDTPALATVKPEALAANLAELRSYGTAIAVIDTPPALTGSIEQVIAMADLIVIPARPSPHDLRAASGTVEMARKAGKPFIFVVNGASPRASITAQAVAALSEHGRVAPVILYQRTEYAASMIDGRTVTETAASGRSAQEIVELWQSVYAQIGLRVAA